MNREEKKRFRLYYFAVDNLNEEEIIEAWNKVNPDHPAALCDIEHIKNRILPTGRSKYDPTPAQITERCKQVIAMRVTNRIKNECPRYRGRSARNETVFTIPVIHGLVMSDDDSEWFDMGRDE